MKLPADPRLLFQLSNEQQKLRTIVVDKIGALDAKKNNSDFEVLHDNIQWFLAFFECFDVAQKLLMPLASENRWVTYLEKHSKILNLENKGGERPQKRQPGFLPLVQLLGMYYFVAGTQELWAISFSPDLITWETLLGNDKIAKALIYQSFHAIRFVYKHYLTFIQNRSAAMTKAKIKKMHEFFNGYLDTAVKYNVLPISLLRAEMNVATFQVLERFELNFKPKDPESDTPFMSSLLIGALKSLLLVDRLMDNWDQADPSSKEAQCFKAQITNAYGVERLTYKAWNFLVPLPKRLAKTNPVADYLEYVQSLAERFCHMDLTAIIEEIKQQAQEILQTIKAIDFTVQDSFNEKLVSKVRDLSPNTLQDLLHNLGYLGLAPPPLRMAKSL